MNEKSDKGVRVVRGVGVEASLATALDRSSDVPLHRQLYEGLRHAVLEGRLVAGTRLPATRRLAVELGVSRNTVMGAFLQLTAEGYVEGRVGSGSYVSSSLPDDLLRVSAERLAGEERDGDESGARYSGHLLSHRGKLLASTRTSTVRDRGLSRAFRPGSPALDEFPYGLWKRLTSKTLGHAPEKLFGYGDAAGYRPLREAIADYAGTVRAVRCSWEQVIVTSGAQQALDLCARLLTDPGDAAWIEDPGYEGTRAALTAAGARLVPVPVDEEGLDVRAAIEKSPDARLACVTPSHQYPLGTTMSLSRRLALLEWAVHHGAWIIEDDYDSEFRYSGRPIEALQGLDNEGRVIYIGTFSKVLFPGLRLGYVIVPPELVDAFVNAREIVDRHPPGVQQATLAEFIVEGHFARHVRRMRTLYQRRQTVLVESVSKELSGLLTVRPAEGGMHLIGWLEKGVDDAAASDASAAYGVEVPPLSLYAAQSPLRPGLLMGYAAVEERRILESVATLAKPLSVLRERKHG